MFKNWHNVGTEGYVSPGILQKKSYKQADVWALVITLYSLVEGIYIFDKAEDTKKGFELQGSKGSSTFNNFVSTMLNDILDGTFIHKKLMNCSWMKR